MLSYIKIIISKLLTIFSKKSDGFIIESFMGLKNELGLGYNKTLIIPPSNDLPTPNTEGTNNNFNNNDNAVINSILNQTQAIDVNPDIINKIDDESGYKTDENPAPVPKSASPFDQIQPSVVTANPNPQPSIQSADRAASQDKRPAMPLFASSTLKPPRGSSPPRAFPGHLANEGNKYHRDRDYPRLGPARFPTIAPPPIPPTQKHPLHKAEQPWRKPGLPKVP